MILEPKLVSDKCIKKLSKPILTKNDIPYEASLIFNAGVIKFQGKYVMVFRNDYGTSEAEYGTKHFSGISLGVAYSDDGVTNWKVNPTPLFDSAILSKTDEIVRIYDPRLTLIDGVPYLCLALGTRHGVCGAVAKTNDSFDKLEIISTTVPDNRNLALFPEKIGGMYVRFERPFPVYGRGGIDRFDMWISKSPDLKYWGESELLLGVEHVPYANDKIGPAAPPIRTNKGWLTTFHAVDIDPSRGKNGWEKEWKKRYTAGIMLLDINNPSKVIGMSKSPLIAPELPFETDEGFRTNVIFPGSMIAEPDGEVKIYYGASDTVECMATAHIDDLLKLCCEEK